MVDNENGYLVEAGDVKENGTVKHLYAVYGPMRDTIFAQSNFYLDKTLRGYQETFPDYKVGGIGYERTRRMWNMLAQKIKGRCGFAFSYRLHREMGQIASEFDDIELGKVLRMRQDHGRRKIDPGRAAVDNPAVRRCPRYLWTRPAGCLGSSPLPPPRASQSPPRRPQSEP